VTAALHARAKRIRERSLVLAWEYRQREHTKGVWFRLRHALVEAAEAWIISEAEGDRLAAEGVRSLPVGAELVPEKRLFVLPAEKLSELKSRHRVPVRLNAELLEARDLVLVPFDGASATRLPVR
jgi:hypothetical protein